MKIDIKKMIKLAKEKHNNNHSLKDGGIIYVDDVKEGDGFIVFSVSLHGYNRGGVSNSGVTMWEGWYAFDGNKEIELISMRMWRDGENWRNDRPWNRWILKQINGKRLVFKNWIEKPAMKKFMLDFEN